jgi:hypothetical protein
LVSAVIAPAVAVPLDELPPNAGLPAAASPTVAPPAVCTMTLPGGVEVELIDHVITDAISNRYWMRDRHFNLLALLCLSLTPRTAARLRAPCRH